MKTFVFSILLLGLAGCGSGPTQAAEPPTAKAANGSDEVAERKQIADAVTAAVARRDFATLSTMEQRYVTGRERTSSGLFKLQHFYNSLAWSLGQTIDRSTGCVRADTPFIADWSRASPNNPAPTLIEARLDVVQAFCIRGGKPAADVAEDAWPRFTALIEGAEEKLRSRYQALAADPEYFAVMIRVLRSSGASLSVQRAMLTEAVRREPYYGAIYTEGGTSFLPQWGGNPGDVELFARFAADHTRQEGQAYYARVYWSLYECGCIQLATDTDWPRFRQGMRDAYDHYPTAYNARYFAKLSCAAGDGAEGRRYIRVAEPGAPDDAVLGDEFAACDRGDYASDA